MNISEKTWKAQARIENSIKHVQRGRFFRIIKMARKPDMDMYKKTCIVSFIMMVLVGGMGFLIYLIWNVLPPMVTRAFGW